MESPLGVCVLPPAARNAARTVSYPNYIYEILGHAGLCYAPVGLDALPAALPELRLLLTLGETASLPGDLADKLEAWVRGGGAWLSVGGLCGLGALLGAEAEPPAYSSWGGGQGTLGEGYLEAREIDHPLLAHLSRPLHFFGGIPVRGSGASVLARALDAHGRPTERAAVLERTVGQGRCLLLAPDIPGSVVHIQQGTAITRDGVSAPDGTATIQDDLLKSDDGSVLDWLFDREPVASVPGLSAFLQPVADGWRELLLRAVFHLATTQRVALPLLWLYPHNLPALAHLSHDTDGNDPAQARQLLAVLAEAQIQSTWCVILPGYDQTIIGAIRDGGHELAMHYDALAFDRPWGESQFDAQWRELTQQFGGVAPVSNKNHYLRWENDTEFFDWCQQRGITLDQSKGASKTGEAGFNFGTCHPYFPVAPGGSLIDVLELPTPTQDLCVFGPEALLEPLLAAATRHHGILHLLFHPAHIDKEGVAAAITRAVSAAHAQGMAWWTAQQISVWERARRRVSWSNYKTDGGTISVSLRTESALAGATILWLCPAAPEDGSKARVTLQKTEESEEQAGSEETTVRWGFLFRALSVDLASGKEHTLRLTTCQEAF